MHVPVADVSYQLRMAAAVKLYELGRLLSGAAARLAGVTRIAFLAKLGDYGVDTFRMTRRGAARRCPQRVTCSATPHRCTIYTSSGGSICCQLSMVG
jgi:hypothetical protein